MLIVTVAALVALQRSVPIYPRQRPDPWISVPSSLRQMNDDSTELEVLGVAAGHGVWLGAFTSSQPFNNCAWWYRLEVEIRKVGEAFTFEPTHESEWIARMVSKGPWAYPAVKVPDLSASTRYRWIARERVQPFTEFTDEGGVARCEPGAMRASGWAWHHVPFDFSFRTPQ